MRNNEKTPTEAEIRALRALAEKAGDGLEVALCDEALRGDPACLAEVARELKRRRRLAKD